MKKTLFIVLITLFSCDTKSEETNQTNFTYRFLDKQSNDNIDLLTTELKLLHKESEKLDFEKLIKFQSYYNLTKKYILFLKEVENEFKTNDKNPFFKGEHNITELGKKYLSVSEIYKNEILKIVDNDYLKKSINLKLNTNNPIIEDGIMVRHIDYYFRELDKRFNLIYLKNKREKTLNIEVDFLHELLLSTKNTPNKSYN